MYCGSGQMQSVLAEVGVLTGDRHVILYGSGFLQKPQAPAQMVSVSPEDLDGFMAAVHRTDPAKGLTLILHTPGGVTNAAETLVAYLRSKFDRIDVIVPTFAMSAGTMMSLAADSIVMGRQSQLGPIDPQMPVAGRSISARAVVDQFERAKLEIVGDSAAGAAGDLLLAHVWAPVLGSIGPALLQEAQNALDYSERMVARWLAAYMFKERDDADARGEMVARYFNDATQHKSHGRRIDRDEARSQGVVVRDLEDNQALQEQVLTLYHLMTIVFQHSGTEGDSEHGRRCVRQELGEPRARACGGSVRSSPPAAAAAGQPESCPTTARGAPQGSLVEAIPVPN